jgi:tRNA-2-methylthio-N6-dimethylallyladenosine synthase
LVHIGAPAGFDVPRIGDVVRCTVTRAGKHYLIADPDPQRDGQVYSIV